MHLEVRCSVVYRIDPPHELFGQLVVNDISRRLREIFFATNALKKDAGTDVDVKPRKVKKLGVLGK